MITNSFNRNNNLIGINIEKTKSNTFIISIAYKENDYWKAKTLGGFSGDIDNDSLLKKVIEKGNSLDSSTAISIFSNSLTDFGEYKK
ncbi:hypothetical protein [Winogradskyella helgolandensis]|uniref:hypothetical protein n=1 Tax=Winogradskyella helgolandensis TaxID=2697010 RepID=UPI0015C7A547|nr:hypothetical protein [Winogradskyella helgolandensis]